MLLLIVLSGLLLAVAIFALENGQAVTVRFVYWEIQSSVAVVTLAATVAGMLIAGLIGVVSRVRRWKRGRAAPRAPLPREPQASAGPASAGASEWTGVH